MSSYLLNIASCCCSSSTTTPPAGSQSSSSVSKTGDKSALAELLGIKKEAEAVEISTGGNTVSSQYLTLSVHLDGFS